MDDENKPVIRSVALTDLVGHCVSIDRSKPPEDPNEVYEPDTTALGTLHAVYFSGDPKPGEPRRLVLVVDTPMYELDYEIETEKK
jgi:hypothetical protein